MCVCVCVCVCAVIGIAVSAAVVAAIVIIAILVGLCIKRMYVTLYSVVSRCVGVTDCDKSTSSQSGPFACQYSTLSVTVVQCTVYLFVRPCAHAQDNS